MNLAISCFNTICLAVGFASDSCGFYTNKEPLPTEDSPEILKRIPNDIFNIIFCELSIPQLGKLSRVSTQWSKAQEKFLNLVKPIFTTIMRSLNGSSVCQNSCFYKIKFGNESLDIKSTIIDRDKWIAFDDNIPDIVIKENWETGGSWDSVMIPGKAYPLGIEYCIVNERLSDINKILIDKIANHIRECILPKDNRLRKTFARYRKFPLLVEKKEVSNNDKVSTELKFYTK
jgi:hypothetical protein